MPLHHERVPRGGAATKATTNEQPPFDISRANESNQSCKMKISIPISFSSLHNNHNHEPQPQNHSNTKKTVPDHLLARFLPFQIVQLGLVRLNLVLQPH